MKPEQEKEGGERETDSFGERNARRKVFPSLSFGRTQDSGSESELGRRPRKKEERGGGEGGEIMNKDFPKSRLVKKEEETRSVGIPLLLCSAHVKHGQRRKKEIFFPTYGHCVTVNGGDRASSQKKKA